MNQFVWFGKRRVILIGFLLALIASLGLPRAASTSPPPRASINLGVFSNSLPVLVAQEEGFFDAQQLDVTFRRVTSSTQQFRSLRSGEYDIISTAGDNVLNYRLNSSNALGSTFPVQIVAGVQYSGDLTVVGARGVTSLAAFQGTNVAVDSPSSGFAYVLYRILELAGLQKDTDYTVIPCGGGDQRLLALRNGSCVVGGVTYTIDGGAILSGPTLLSAQQEGFPVLQSIQETPGLSPYLGTVIVATEPWLEENEDVAVRFVAALYAAVEWSLDPANRERALEILLQDQPSAGQAGAELQYTTATAPGIGLVRGLDINRDALRTVVELREEFNGFDQPQNVSYLVTPASKLYDESYVRQAERLLRQQAR